MKGKVLYPCILQQESHAMRSSINNGEKQKRLWLFLKSNQIRPEKLFMCKILKSTSGRPSYIKSCVQMRLNFESQCFNYKKLTF